MEALIDRPLLNQRDSEGSDSQSKPGLLRKALSVLPPLPKPWRQRMRTNAPGGPVPLLAAGDARSQLRPTTQRRMRQGACSGRARPRAPVPGGCQGQRAGPAGGPGPAASSPGRWPLRRSPPATPGPRSPPPQLASRLGKRNRRGGKVPLLPRSGSISDPSSSQSWSVQINASSHQQIAQGPLSPAQKPPPLPHYIHVLTYTHGKN